MKAAHITLWILFCLPLCARCGDAAERGEFFERYIRPAIVEHCYECHSGESTAVEGGLRLDTRDGLLKGGDSGPAVVPGDSAKSLLISALEHRALEMPPDEKLAPALVQHFRQWVEDGAYDPRDGASATNSAAKSWEAELRERATWWSLQPPQKQPLPKVSDAAWPRTPVDHFILSALDDRRIKPAPSAKPEVLLRRLCFVLTGLPPTTEQATTFPPAYEEAPQRAWRVLVDQLLASPHFGEHFARRWMDVVRYTDTYGYEWDIPAKGSWEYRDYLTRAFNNDIGFDQLIREQVAGDLLPQARLQNGVNESMIGPMFFHLGEHRHGSSLAFNGIHQEMIDNKIDAFSKAFLAMTVSCARCHNHKLDAVSQRDYYALAGVFMTPRWTARPIDSPTKHLAQITRLKSLRGEIRRALSERWTRNRGPLASGESLRQWAVTHPRELDLDLPGDPVWPFPAIAKQFQPLPTKLVSAESSHEATRLEQTPRKSLLARGPVPETDRYTVVLDSQPGVAQSLRLQTLTHESLGAGGPGRTAHGNFVLSQIRVRYRGLGDETATEVKIRSATADYSQPNYPVSAAIVPAGGWGIGLGGSVDRTATFVFDEPAALAQGGRWTIELNFALGTQHVLGHFRLELGADVSAKAKSTNVELADTQAAEKFAALAEQWRGLRSIRRKENERFSTVVDFAKPGLPDDWQVDGAGLVHGYAAAATPRVSIDSGAVLAEFLEAGYHTHALSSKLPGALRLPAPESFARERVTLRLMGGEWAGRRDVPQNAFLNEGPHFFHASEAPAWQGIATVPLRNGVTRVLTEITTATLNSNFPPRTGVARAGGKTLPDKDEGQDKRSWFSLTGAVSHDGGGAPSDTLPEYAELYAQTPSSDSECWQRMRDWLAAAVDRWCAGESRMEDAKLLNWMLQRQLLDNHEAPGTKVAALLEEYRTVESAIDFSRAVNSMDERGVAAIDYRLNVRGNVYNEGDPVPRGFLEVFRGRNSVAESRGSGRLALAKHLASRENPQAARVYVNRLWQWVFGTGLVATPNDFGKLGGRPSHPELLDWLAVELMDRGWSTKQLLRLLLLSQTFRQSGNGDPSGREVDPANRLLHHYPMRRLTAESIRDSLLDVSGELDRRLYGPPINPPRSHEDSKKRLFSGPLKSYGRRSLYLEMSIMSPPQFLTGFNLPSVKLPTGKRDETNVPAQALILLNGNLSHAVAEAWGERLLQDNSDRPEDRIRRMFVRALGREPRIQEVTRWRRGLLEFATSQTLMDDQPAWTALAHAMFNTKEFIYYR